MGRKERRGHGGPPVDSFGANDPAWERYEGVSGLRHWKPVPFRVKTEGAGTPCEACPALLKEPLGPAACGI